MLQDHIPFEILLSDLYRHIAEFIFARSAADREVWTFSPPRWPCWSLIKIVVVDAVTTSVTNGLNCSHTKNEHESTAVEMRPPYGVCGVPLNDRCGNDVREGCGLNPDVVTGLKRYVAAVWPSGKDE
ncbi:hypothetical protein EVAR_14130_1 [Eumeta japonica]|uniref:Uncharacterized protein n=1 Tax=Eumeta variegata TaxID=151549 RepID=A0A4C1UFA2_EUMVA|nr:hypothetical protein EVAR_14130_1 [Eumeta japonica]